MKMKRYTIIRAVRSTSGVWYHAYRIGDKNPHRCGIGRARKSAVKNYERLFCK